VGAQAEKQLPALAGKLDTTLDTITQAAAEIRSATRKNGEALHSVLSQIPALMRDGAQLMRDGEEVIAAAKNSWLLRDYIEPAAMRTVPLDSFESRSGGARIPAAAAQR
jgi:hypothetical protein